MVGKERVTRTPVKPGEIRLEYYKLLTAIINQGILYRTCKTARFYTMPEGAYACIRVMIDQCYFSLSVGRSVSLCISLCLCVSVCSHVFSRTVAAVDIKRGYVGMCNWRSTQQESGAVLSKNSVFTRGG